MERPTCPGCNYDLSGHVGPAVIRCPECGRESTIAEAQTPPLRPPLSRLGILMAIICGSLHWTIICWFTGKREAWDDFGLWASSYAVLSLALGALFPAHAWVWGFLFMVGQTCAAFAANGVSNIWPIACGIAGLLAVPFMLMSQLGGYLGILMRGKKT